MIEVEKLLIAGFDTMAEKYTIVELLTSAKPFYFEWLFRNYPAAENVVYFDPDIMLFQPLRSLEESLKIYDVILTPHFTTPINDNCLPTELHVMQTGVFNLGFIAVKRSPNSNNMLQWWISRLKDQCLIDLSRGLFVDQLWANLMPAYFDKVLIEKYPGYNMAHWNLHERILRFENNEYRVNGQPLVFYHFSHYNPAHPEAIASHHNRYDFASRPDLVDLYDAYKESLVRYHYFELKKVPCFYLKDEQKKKRKREMEAFLRMALPDKLKGRLKRIAGKK
ncbi:MAG TPA: hypothetical protein VFW07_15885 [Parafilimonas sp.]|nr:hypothetical protein [Parafilimonas sp.]